TLETMLDEPVAALRLMLVEPSASAGAERLSVIQQVPTPNDATLFVGPEGGWIEPEWSAAAAHGVRLVTLGERTLRADAVAVAEGEAGGAGAVFVEIRRLEPLALLRRIDRRHIVLAGRQPTDSVLAGLIGPRGHDLTRLRLPERRVGGEGEDGVVGQRRPR